MAEPIKILTNRGNVILVDETDADLIKEVWSVTGQGYAERKKKEDSGRRNLSMHRLILSRKLGRNLAKDEQVDHINHNRLDNRRSNLRIATAYQNSLSRIRHRNNTSGYTGVTYNKRPGRQKRWQAYIKVNGKMQFLGLYLTAKEAARAYDNAAMKHHGEFASLNFPAGVSNE